MYRERIDAKYFYKNLPCLIHRIYDNSVWISLQQAMSTYRKHCIYFSISVSTLVSTIAATIRRVNITLTEVF